MKTNKKRRTWLWVLVTVAVILGLGYLGLRQLAAWRNAQMAMMMGETGTGDIVTVTVGDLATSATASGRVTVGREASLALATSGTVAEVRVEAGDQVRTGDLLLALETDTLGRAVESARQALAAQEANLAATLAPPRREDLMAAEAAVASAQANLADLLDGPSDEEVASSEADLRAADAEVAAAAARLNSLVAGGGAAEIQAAEIELELAQVAATQAAEQHSTILVTEPNQWLSQDRLDDMEFAARTSAVQANAQLAAAQQALDDLLRGDPYAIASARASLALSQAQRDLTQAQHDLLLEGPTSAQIAAAGLNLAQAEANLDRLLRGPSATQISLGETQVEQARLSLRRAENDLSKAALLAPFDGTITAVKVGLGEQAAGVLVEMVDTANLEVALEVDEVDIGAITVGQPAIITLESWPEVEIPGQVASIAPRSSGGNSALVTYQVTLSFGETELPVRVGMTADADLVTTQRENVLLVPNAAITPDRDRGTYSVNLVGEDAEGAQTIDEVEVTIGLRDRNFTQVTSGLAEGDELFIGDPSVFGSFGPGSGRGGPGHIFGGG